MAMKKEEDVFSSPQPCSMKKRYKKKIATSCQAFSESSNLRESQLSEQESKSHI